MISTCRQAALDDWCKPLELHVHTFKDQLQWAALIGNAIQRCGWQKTTTTVTEQYEQARAQYHGCWSATNFAISTHWCHIRLGLISWKPMNANVLMVILYMTWVQAGQVGELVSCAAIPGLPLELRLTLQANPASLRLTYRLNLRLPDEDG